MGERIPAVAVIVAVAPEPHAREQDKHYEIEWRGRVSMERAGQWYHTYNAAMEMAVECGAKEIVNDAC